MQGMDHTAIESLLQAVARMEKQGARPSDADIAASFRRAVVEQLVERILNKINR